MANALDQLKKCTNLSDLANLLGYEPKKFAWIIYKNNSNYSKFEIKKKSGGTRTIEKPSSKLKSIQQKLSELLYDCKSDISPNSSNICSHGYERGRSIITNANIHRNKKFVCNIDLKDFFPSINFGRVYGYFQKNNNFLLHPDVAKVIAKIATNENGLPQGSPLSPIISNLITQSLDNKLLNLSKKYHLSYSRYVDDITFSTNKGRFPIDIGYIDNGTVKLSKALVFAIESSGFYVNHEKSRIQNYREKQEVTGLIVNKRVNIPKDYRKYVRAMVHSYIDKGEFYLSDIFLVRHFNKFNKKESPTKVLQGMLGYIDNVDLYSQYKSALNSTYFSDFHREPLKTHRLNPWPLNCK